jgi:drug/metabolite transporter (DMT)-like permease
LGLLIVANPIAIIRSGNFGLCISALASIAFALYTTLGKLRIKKLGGNVENSFSFLIGCTFLLVVLVFHGDPILGGITTTTIVPLLYCSFVVTGFGYLCFMKAIELTGPSNASFSFFLKPVIALFLSAIILSEPVTVECYCGIGFDSCRMYLGRDLLNDLFFISMLSGKYSGLQTHPAWVTEQQTKPLGNYYFP